MMPRGAFPPTPASSTDIQGQDGSKQLASLQMAFELPPPALDGRVSPTASLDAEMNTMPHSHGSSMEMNTMPHSHGSSMEMNTMPHSHGSSMDTPLVSAKQVSSSATSPSSKSLYPMQAAEAVKSRRRSSALQAQTQANATASPSGKDAFALPPPPARSRKIIQMKPRMASSSGASVKAGGTKDKAGTSTPSSTGKSGRGVAATATATATATCMTAEASTETTDAAGSKKKQPSSTSAAGRKIARKTAHSLIERRRRSKMNEEFAVLKGMIPACTGEMHKLAILQASIEYVRYLEDCVATLKAQRESGERHGQQHEQQHRQPHGHSSSDPSLSPRAMLQHGNHTPRYSSRIYMDEDAVSPDVKMTGTGGQGEEEEEGSEEDGDDDDDDDDDENDENDDHGEEGSKGDNEAARHQASISPALHSQSQQPHESQQYYSNSQCPPQKEARHNSYSSSASSTRYSPNLSAVGPHQHPLPPLPPSATASPFLYGQASSAAATPLLGARGSIDNVHDNTSSVAPSISGSALTSPVLLPQRDMDREATAALLMLNSDRRGRRDSIIGSRSAAGRGMSVQDLLST